MFILVFFSQVTARMHCSPVVLEVLLDAAEDLKEYLHQLDGAHGVMRVKPACVIRLLQSKACRGAIMFGDVLSQRECEHLLDGVRRCRLPFNCAHGRPSVLPLVDLNDLE
jgi:DNA mismatch repair protein MLH3